MKFWTAIEQTLLNIVTQRDIMSLAILSVILYGFYYPAPYAHQSAQALPLVVVDGDHSALSRRLIHDLGTVRAVKIEAVLPDMASARAAVQAREAEGILLLSDNLSGEALTGRGSAGLGLWINGTYLLRAESIGSAITEVLNDAVGALRAQTSGNHGAAAQTPPILVQPLYNTTDGYRDYVFPAVANIILQQTLLLATARLSAERRRKRQWQGQGMGYALGSWAACTLIGILAAFFYFGFLYWVQDIPRGGNIPALFIAVPLFAGAVSALGLWLGSYFRSGDDAVKIIAPTSLPLVFIAGFAWPLSHMPQWLATLAWLSPATAGMHSFVRFNQMGAHLSEAGGPLMVLAALMLVYGAAFLWRSRRFETLTPHERG